MPDLRVLICACLNRDRRSLLRTLLPLISIPFLREFWPQISLFIFQISLFIFTCLAVTDFKSNSRIHDILHRWANKEVANRLCYTIAIWAPRQAYSLNKNHDIRRKIPLCELRSRFDLRLSDVLDKTDKKRRIQYSHFDGCDHRSWTDGVHLNN